MATPCIYCLKVHRPELACSEEDDYHAAMKRARDTMPKHDVRNVKRVHLFGGTHDGETIECDVRPGYVKLRQEYRHDIAAFTSNIVEVEAMEYGVDFYNIERFEFGGPSIYFGLPQGVTPLMMFDALWRNYVEGELE